MRVLVNKFLSHHHPCIDAFLEGFDTVNNEIHHFKPNSLPKREYDIAICWNTRQMDKLKRYAKIKDFLIFENAYLNNIQGKDKEWVSLGWNGLNGRADFCNENSPNDRWKKHFDDGRLLKYSNGEYILIPLQIKGDQSLRFVDNKLTYQWICEEIRKYTDLPIVIKDHPTRPGSQPKVVSVPNVRYLNLRHPIEEVIKNAKVVVTINSNAGVDAILGGKPVVSLDEGSMVWDISDHDFTKLNVPTWYDRDQWCNNIAYAQWHPDELRSGEAWDHLKKRVELSLQTH